MASTKEGPPSGDLGRLAELICSRNDIDAEIAGIIGRPAEKGHLGEYVAARIFDIQLNATASAKVYDGRFASGPLAGRSVDVKYYAKQGGILDLSFGELPDFYLVLILKGYDAPMADQPRVSV